ncbi:MAG: methionine synthase [Deltaproteobacteria bacterium]|nr:methionine synthase [Deltaproteobacteria bacterium]
MKPSLKELLLKKILVLDGAMGTALQGKNLTAQDFGGPTYEGCFEVLNLTRPTLIESVHQSYLEAGCDIIETNTFGATPLVLAEYGIAEQAQDINFHAAQIARKIADLYTTPEKPRYVAGSMGPTTKAISVTGGATFHEMIEHYYVQAKGLALGGVDYLLLETCQDTRNIKAALFAIDRMNEERLHSSLHPLETAISVTVEPMGTLLAGQSIEALYAALSHRELLYLGLNCATGPEFMTDHIRTLSHISRFPVACVPNAGLPDADGHYLETPSMMTTILSRFTHHGWINLMGGCCGTTSEHIHSFVELAHKTSPRPLPAHTAHLLSGIDPLDISPETRPIVVGERTNVIGSQKFKTLICDEKYEEASEIARKQVKRGAQIIDICLANPDRDELKDMESFLSIAMKKIRVPIMIDSTDAAVIDKALTYCQGKSIINSINLEDGEERFQKVIPIGLKHGASYVIGTIDDDPKQGMGITRTRKLDIAKRAYVLLKNKYAVCDEDMYWDPLVFPCATGDKIYIGSAQETIEGIRLLKAEFPKTKTILGISNVSFGLPPAGREVLNSVFLHECVEAGLDLAIVNAEKLIRWGAIPEEEKTLAKNLLYNLGADPIGNFVQHFRKQKVKCKTETVQGTLEERLASYIIEGSKDGLIADLNEALKTQKPLYIINGPLMKGMEEVGRLFNKNEMIVAEVLQSAEAMKAAVSYLEPFMEKKDTSSKGKILLATVKGDVHDIGKNLVEIILSNNGFEVIDLGIKVPPEVLIQNAQHHRPDIIGLSGLLVKSAQQMVVTADDFSKAGIAIPLLVGGAALTRRFVDQKIAKAYQGTVIYASDAMHGLELAKAIVDATSFQKLQQDLVEQRNLPPATKTSNSSETSSESTFIKRSIEILSEKPLPPDYERHVLRYTSIEHIFSFMNPLMLYTRHLGISGSVAKQLQNIDHNPSLKQALSQKDSKAIEIYEMVQSVKEEYKKSDALRPTAVYQFFKAKGQENRIALFLHPEDPMPSHFLTFPRQKKPPYLCLSDFVHPKEDALAFLATSVGKGLREEVAHLKQAGQYLKSHILQILALESAEAYAELLHAHIRKAWGFLDPESLTKKDLFQANYRGKRFSFGYPACPNLEDQKILFELLKPQDIGMTLTDGYMMDPEASVSAVVFHHPKAVYFAAFE